jgi:HD-GYP domain-containing protein (c-di-GMP phosphodiesterase class II)
LDQNVRGEKVYVELAVGGLLGGKLRAALGDPFEVSSETGDHIDVRLVGPEELAEQGTRLLRRLQLRRPQVPTVGLVARQTPVDALRDFYHEGIREVVFTDEIETALEGALFRVVENARASRVEEETASHMAAELGSRARKLAQALDQVRDAYDQTLTALVAALDSRERETANHSQRVAAYAVLLGMRAGVTGEALEDLYRGALLHDIGKIGIPDSILLKPDKLTAAEWEIMRSHPEIGARVLGRISFLSGAVEVPLSHHEAWDGTGYPGGLRGDEIPFSARIFAVVDSYDAIRSHRPYKPALPHAEAMVLLGQASTTRLDPSLVETFCAEPECSWDQLAEASQREGTFREAFRVCRTGLTP